MNTNRQTPNTKKVPRQQPSTPPHQKPNILSPLQQFSPAGNIFSFYPVAGFLQFNRSHSLGQKQHTIGQRTANASTCRQTRTPRQQERRYSAGCLATGQSQTPVGPDRYATRESKALVNYYILWLHFRAQQPLLNLPTCVVVYGTMIEAGGGGTYVRDDTKLERGQRLLREIYRQSGSFGKRQNWSE